MAAYDRQAFTPDTGLWTRTVFITRLGTDLDTYREIILARSKGDQNPGGSISNATVDPKIQAHLDAEGSSGVNRIFYSRCKCRDTTLGGNDALNSLYQYCKYDDLGTNFTKSVNGSDFMGRVYSENIDDTQQILWLAFGTPVYNNLRGFYNNAVSTSLSEIMINGPEIVSANKIGRLVGNVSAKLVTLPLAPLYILNYLYRSATRVPVTRYYDFKNQMPLYYRMVNTITLMIATNLGFRDSDYRKGRYKSSTVSSTGSKTTNQTENEIINASNKETSDSSEADGIKEWNLGGSAEEGYSTGEELGIGSTDTPTNTGMPDLIDVYGLDIYKIQHRKAGYENAQLNLGAASTDSALLDQSATSPYRSKTNNGDGKDTDSTKSFLNEYISAFFVGATDSLYNQAMYIGFRIDKTTQATENVSNQTGPSEIKSTMNSKFGQLQNAAFTVMNGNFDDGVLGSIVQGSIKAATSFVSGAMEGLGFLGGASALSTGAVRIDVPDIWQDSSFTKSYNFNMELKAPYGNSISILQDLYIPLACILAGSLPRATGATSYTSPFLCQAYVKGMFSVPLGMIDNVSISRANDQHGMTLQRLPTSMNISFSIKDMSPTMYLSMGDGYGLFDSFLGNTSSMLDYINTLSGMGLVERTDRAGFHDFKRRFKQWWDVGYYTKFNPYYWGSQWGVNAPVRTFVNIVGYTPGQSNS